MNEWLNYAKEKIERGKEDALVWYSVASRWFTMGSILLYLAACIVAGGMVGPVRYVEFLNNACHFEQPAQAAGETKRGGIFPLGSKGDDIIPLPPIPEKPKRAPVSKPESSF